VVIDEDNLDRHRREANHGLGRLASSRMSTLPVSALAKLIDAAASIVAETELPVVLRRIAETAKQLTGARYAALGVVGEYGLLTEFIHAGLDRHTAEMIGHLPTGRGVLGLLIREGETIRLDDISAHPDSVGFPPNHPPMTNFLGVPLRVGTKVFGNIYLTEKDNGFTDDDEMNVEALAVIAGAAVGTSRLREQLERLAVAGERERIARDVHDSIVQDLFAVGLSLQMIAGRLEDDSITRELDRIADQIDRAISSLRMLILGLRSEGPPEDLAASIRAAVIELVPPGGPDLVVEAARGAPFDDDLLDAVLAIAKEGASNAIRHASAGQILIRVDRPGSNVVISIIDDGTGFEPTLVSRGMGLDNMSARAASRGGSMEIVSQEGRGTVIEVVLPLQV
jgi:signal transduction histidine kinase